MVHTHRPSARRGAWLMPLLILATPVSGFAQEPTATTQDPPKARILRGAPPPVLEAAPGLVGATPSSSTGGEADLTLRIGYTTATLRNPATKALDTVRLRSYTSEGQPTGTNVPYIAPTIEVFPGETVRITLKNDLPEEAEDCGAGGVNVPHCYNTTNLHGHGLAVSPSGNSDNVLISIKPNVTFQYEYNIPADHPSGTFWYHPHRHGSTALQVSSGMAGALIIRGNRLPTATKSGDIDTLLRRPDGTPDGEPFLERLLVLQQIQYACYDKITRDIKKNDDGTWKCDPGDTGIIESYNFGSWKASGRYTTVNGRTVEPLGKKAVVGQVERWRFVHAGVRTTVKVSIRRRVSTGSVAQYATLSAARQQEWIDANCDKNLILPQWEIAADGLTRDLAHQRQTTWLQPGYRSDLLMLFPSAGDYCVIDEEASPAQAVNGEDPGRQLLTVVTAEGGTPVTNITARLKEELLAGANAFMREDAKARVVTDLETFKLSAFVPHKDLRPETPSKTQNLMFGFPGGGLAGVGTGPDDIKAYDPEAIDRQLTLGAIEDWKLMSKTAGHPFHIHVNPFQIVSARGPKDEDLLNTFGSEYYQMGGVWKDTLFVQQGTTITVRTKYERYIGDFVLHCHILDHEDTGMMQNVRIALPDGRGGQAPATHSSMGHGPRTKTSESRNQP